MAITGLYISIMQALEGPLPAKRYKYYRTDHLLTYEKFMLHLIIANVLKYSRDSKQNYILDRTKCRLTSRWWFWCSLSSFSVASFKMAASTYIVKQLEFEQNQRIIFFWKFNCYNKWKWEIWILVLINKKNQVMPLSYK